jgi:hypothetical protein
MNKDMVEKDVPHSASCPAHHHNPRIKNLHMLMFRQFDGINPATIAGINDSIMLRLLGEIGLRYESFSRRQAFCRPAGIESREQTKR